MPVITSPLAFAIAAPGRFHPRPALVVALLVSIALHVGLSLWNGRLPSPPESAPLMVSITELPPPPKPSVATAVSKPRPAARPRVKRPAPPPPPPISEPVLAAGPAPEVPPAAADPVPGPATELAEAAPALPVAPPPVLAITEEALPPASMLDKTLPPRVDLVYKAFFGTRGFLIGEAVYRFEHADGQYRIVTVGEAQGLAALLLRGQGRLESRGNITASGLQPLEFVVERGSHERREVAQFDWETGMVVLHEQKTAALDLPTYDPLTLMWQFYFAPPTDGRFGFAVATTRRVGRYVFTREGTDTIGWAQGEVETERWHRRSEDGETDAWIWLAPSLHFIPIKMRVARTWRGTVEALLDSIRIDDKLASQ